MIKKFLIIIICFFTASVFSVSVSASSLDSVILPPNLDGFTTDMQDSTFEFVKSRRIILGIWLDVLRGNKTVSEALADSVEVAIDSDLQFLSDLVEAYDNNTLTKRELVYGVVNYILNDLEDKGGSVSRFPVSGTQISIPGGGYIEFYDEERGNQPGYFDLGYRVFAPDGTLAYEFLWSIASYPPSGSAPFWNIYPLGYEVVSSHTNLTVSFDYYYAWGAPAVRTLSRDVYIPWIVYDGTFENITETPNVDGLSDDDLIKYIDNLIDKLESTYPDLSTVEGLLRAILNQLKKNDMGGCDCSDVLAELNAAIISLANDSNAQNAQIISLLQAIKDNVNNNNGITTDIDLDPLLQKLDKIVADLDYLKLINTIELLTDGWDKLTAAEKSYLNEYSKLIVTIGNKFGFTAINNVISSFNSIIFTNSPPRDLTIIYQGRTYVFLSTSTFGKLSSSVSTVRAFVSIVIIVSWAYSIRRKIMEGI